MAVKVSGSRTKTLVELTIDELEIEGNYLYERAVLERDKLIANGETKRNADKIILAQLGTQEEFVKAWVNKNNKIIDELHSQLVAQPVREVGLKNPKAKFVWVLDSSAKHCADCLDQADKPARTIDEILDDGVGLPRDGLTICNVGCKCQLTPE